NYLAEQSKLESRTKELQAAQAAVEQKVASLTEALASEAKRREAGERLAADGLERRRDLEGQLAKSQETEERVRRDLEALERGKRRNELEAELAEHKQAQAQLQRQLDEVRKQLQAKQESSTIEQSKLEARTQDLQAAQSEVVQQVQRLTDSLAQET